MLLLSFINNSVDIQAILIISNMGEYINISNFVCSYSDNFHGSYTYEI